MRNLRTERGEIPNRVHGPVFNLDCVNRLMVVKKREPAVERCFKYIAHFVAWVQSKGDDDSVNSMFTQTFFKHLVRGINTKDKTVYC
jgi:hypothetical protein